MLSFYYYMLPSSIEGNDIENFVVIVIAIIWKDAL